MGFLKILYSSAVILFTLFLSSVHGQEGKLRVAYDAEGYLSVAAENAELREVLAAIGEKTGISMRYPENLRESVTIQFERVSIEESLHRILRDINHVLFFSPSGEKDKGVIVTGVFIPPQDAEGQRARRVPPSVPSQSRQEQKKKIEEVEEAPAGGVEREEEEGEDPILARYERQLDQLEDQLDMVGEDSPQGSAILNRIVRLRQQIEKRLEELDREETQ